MADFSSSASPAQGPLVSWSRWLAWFAPGPCPSCAAPGRAPLCAACRTGSGIIDGSLPAVAVLENDVRLLYLGFYWRPSASNARRREPTPLAQALHRFKFGGDRYAGHCLARLFAEALSNSAAAPGRAGAKRYDAVVPIPLSRAGLAARRFNQSAWLARPLARRARIPYRPGWLQRHGDSEAQHGLRAAARRTNMHHAFRAGLLPQRPGLVLLVDDVCTTGSTLAAAARVLCDGGAVAVGAAVLILAEANPMGDRR